MYALNTILCAYHVCVFLAHGVRYSPGEYWYHPRTSHASFETLHSFSRPQYSSLRAPHSWASLTKSSRKGINPQPRSATRRTLRRPRSNFEAFSMGRGGKWVEHEADRQATERIVVLEVQQLAFGGFYTEVNTITF